VIQADRALDVRKFGRGYIEWKSAPSAAPAGADAHGGSGLAAARPRDCGHAIGEDPIETCIETISVVYGLQPLIANSAVNAALGRSPARQDMAR
jgi:hypothetical protein